MANGTYRGARLQEDEDRDLKHIAEVHGLGLSDAIRFAIAEAGQRQSVREEISALEQLLEARIAQAEQRIAGTVVHHLRQMLGGTK